MDTEGRTPPERGVFVVLEGGDGAGKTTQARLLDRWLSNWGRAHLLTHEPGDSWLGRRLRELVLSPDSGPICAKAETLLYNADKAQHVAEVVLPALGRGEVVVSDRYVDSTVAYQGAGRSLEPAEVEQVARWATDDLRPDLTVLLDVVVSEGAGRLTERDRLESEGEDFHERVRRHFLDLAGADPEHHLVLDARAPREEIAATIRARLAPLVGIGEQFVAPVPPTHPGAGGVSEVDGTMEG